jgi:hypothetical protein
MIISHEKPIRRPAVVWQSWGEKIGVKHRINPANSILRNVERDVERLPRSRTDAMDVSARMQLFGKPSSIRAVFAVCRSQFASLPILLSGGFELLVRF